MRKRRRFPKDGPPSHRLAGVEEQLTRARTLLAEAHAVRDYDLAFPKLIAAVYPARAALEIMREAAKLGELSISLTEFDRLVDERVPRWRLIQAVRVRDFHHYGVQGWRAHDGPVPDTSAAAQRGQGVYARESLRPAAPSAAV